MQSQDENDQGRSDENSSAGSFAVSVAVRGSSVAVQVTPQTLLCDLQQRLEQLTGIPVDLQRLLHDGRQLKEAQSALTLEKLGIGPNTPRMRLLQHSTQEDVEELDRILDRHKAQQEQQQLFLDRNVGRNVQKKRHSEYTFSQFRVLSHHQTPPPARAMDLLHKLADDRAICHIMEKYKWRVGLLSEMEPEGKVGVSEICILGFNKGRGMEISLRLRTDDLKGFRRYDTIKDTLLHELSHMIHDQHNKDFYDLLRILQAEYQKWDWTSTSSGNKLIEGDYHKSSPRAILRDSHSSGQKTGGSLSASHRLAPSMAAANAAIARQKMAKPLLDAESPSVPKSHSYDKAEDNEKLLPYVEEDDPSGKESSSMTGSEQLPQPKEVQSELIRLLVEKKRSLRELQSGDGGQNLSDVPTTTHAVAEASQSMLSRYNQALDRFLTALIVYAQDDKDREIALQTLSQCIKNVLTHPAEEKFKKLRLTNPSFYSKLARFDGAVDYLNIAGFRKDELGEHLQIKSVDAAALWMGRSLLDDCIVSVIGRKLV